MNIEHPYVIGVEVVSVNQNERATVRGSGGFGFTFRGTGFTVPVNVQTTHQKWLEVWVKRPDGREDRLDFNGVDLLVREGHKLALLMSGSQIWAVRNFSTGISTAFVGPGHLVGPIKWPRPGWLLAGFCLLYLVGLMIGKMIVGGSDLIFDIASIVPLGGVALLVLFYRKSKKRWDSEMAEAGRLLAEGAATLESAKLNSGIRQAAIANG